MTVVKKINRNISSNYIFDFRPNQACSIKEIFYCWSLNISIHIQKNNKNLIQRMKTKEYSDNFVRNKKGVIFGGSLMKSMFSKTCEYGIKATAYIAQQSLQYRRVSLKEIAEEIGSPIAFTAKILHQLAKNNILDSTKGPSGGFQISKEQIDDIKLIDVVMAVDGDSIYEGCGLGFDKCNANKPCIMHNKFALVREELKQMLKSTSLFELATSLETGLTYLKR